MGCPLWSPDGQYHAWTWGYGSEGNGYLWHNMIIIVDGGVNGDGLFGRQKGNTHIIRRCATKWCFAAGLSFIRLPSVQFLFLILFLTRPPQVDPQRHGKWQCISSEMPAIVDAGRRTVFSDATRFRCRRHGKVLHVRVRSYSVPKYHEEHSMCKQASMWKV